ncbi:SulP family inorganic anion transporter [Desulfogranum japonicum]|uniref:SulP family inorganic anion transporter n=1 Tax=Desulfogranum japonicum TaxID=231447 RepID=UPI00040B8164|nr:sulfate permease [Desulfogranum japonicum]
MTPKHIYAPPTNKAKSRLRKLLPFLRWWGFIGWDTIKADLLAGITGAVIVLPQGVAFAMIAGLPPEYGLYTAIITPVVAALFGSSLHLISGPTTAISIVVFSTVSSFAEPGSAEYIRLVLTLTFLAGVYQLAFGLARLGTLVNFVSHSVVIGFTSGAAILIATSQLKHVLGIKLPGSHDFFEVWLNIFGMLNQVNLFVFAVAMVTLIFAVYFRAKIPRWPGMLFAMVIGSLLSLLLHGSEHGVTLVGQMPAKLPPLSLPDFSVETVRELAPDALAVALLGLIEALSIGRSIAAKSHQPIDGNQEFIGQGLSNVIGCFFSSYAGSGSFTRSGINYQAGAITPLSAVFAAVFLALLLLLVAPLTAYLPIAAMGGIILMVAYHLIDVHHIRTILKTSKEETAVMMTTFFATLFLDLEFAIYIGVLLSLILYLNRTAHPRIINLAPNLHPEIAGPPLIESEAECSFLKIIRIDGPLFFGAVNHISEFLYNIDKTLPRKRHVLILGCGINFIDIAGAELLAQEAKRRASQRGGLYLCELQPQVYNILERGGYLDQIGKNNIFVTQQEAVNTIMLKVDPILCRNCLSPIFKQCKDLAEA